MVLAYLGSAHLLIRHSLGHKHSFIQHHLFVSTFLSIIGRIYCVIAEPRIAGSNKNGSSIPTDPPSIATAVKSIAIATATTITI
jgi:hypothetical protein